MEVQRAMILLELPENFNENELDKAFRKKSLQYHPDRIGGSTDSFNALNNAFNVLKEMPDMSDMLFMQTMLESNYFMNDSDNDSSVAFADIRSISEVSSEAWEALPPSAGIASLSQASSKALSVAKASSEANVSAITYTIPITIRDYYYNKGKRIVVLNNNNEKVSLEYKPCYNKKYYEKENIMFKTRICEADERAERVRPEATSERSGRGPKTNNEFTIENSILVKHVNISLADFLYEKKLKVRVFNEELTIERQLGGPDNEIYCINANNFDILLENKGFYKDPIKKIRNNLIVRLNVLSHRQDIQDNEENMYESFSFQQ